MKKRSDLLSSCLMKIKFSRIERQRLNLSRMIKSNEESLRMVRIWLATNWLHAARSLTTHNITF